MLSKQDGRRKDLLKMVKPEVTKIDPKDLNVSSILTNRNLFAKQASGNGSDSTVDVVGNSVTETLFKNKQICSAENATTAQSIHNNVLDYTSHVGNALNQLKLGNTRLFNLSKMIDDAKDTIDVILITTVSYISEHIQKFGADLANCIEKVDHVANRLTRWIRDSLRWVHLTDERKEVINKELDSANEAMSKAVDDSLNEDVPYVDEDVTKSDLQSRVSVKDGENS